jgi:GNAT superfamily N-acetyltransferase
MAIYLREAVLTDVDEIVAVIEEGRQFLAEQGIDQWQNGYPGRTDILADLQKNVAHVLVVDDTIAGYAALVVGEDTAYTKITSGSWREHVTPYTAIHRVAVSAQYRGQKLTQQLFSNIFTLQVAKGHTDFRIDTHPENHVMQHVAEKLGFEKRGIVQFEGERWAYQLVL